MIDPMDRSCDCSFCCFQMQWLFRSNRSRLNESRAKNSAAIELVGWWSSRLNSNKKLLQWLWLRVLFEKIFVWFGGKRFSIWNPISQERIYSQVQRRRRKERSNMGIQYWSRMHWHLNQDAIRLNQSRETLFDWFVSRINKIVWKSCVPSQPPADFIRTNWVW